ncbi:hypothetical protein chiPu_0002549 [Chiloscyllium punctatum]|uniref:Uncharacterized protein n=1 Tax=Chiloscyllium punctatum TaxID=137246 RepID=A0A401S183_CHIPU|nr:hypothetical protein [Chiloscyllium punctatum]
MGEWGAEGSGFQTRPLTPAPEYREEKVKINLPLNRNRAARGAGSLSLNSDSGARRFVTNHIAHWGPAHAQPGGGGGGEEDARTLRPLGPDGWRTELKTLTFGRHEPLLCARTAVAATHSPSSVLEDHSLLTKCTWCTDN